MVDVIHGVEKSTEQTMLLQSTYAIFLCHDSPFGTQICIFEKTVHSSPTSCNINQINPNHIPYIIYSIFISRVHQPNDKLRLVLWSISVSKLEVKVNLVGF